MDGLGWVSSDSAKRIHLSGGCEAEREASISAEINYFDDGQE